MNTKSALIIAVAIVIGFSIKPILDSVDFSEPYDRVIKINIGSAQFYVRAGSVNWSRKVISGVPVFSAEKSTITPATQEAAETIDEIIKLRNED